MRHIVWGDRHGNLPPSPINPGAEEQSWKRFAEEGVAKFLAGESFGTTRAGAVAALLGLPISEIRLSQSDLWPKYGRAEKSAGALDNMVRTPFVPDDRTSAWAQYSVVTDDRAGGWVDVIFATEPTSVPVPADVPAACDPRPRPRRRPSMRCAS